MAMFAALGDNYVSEAGCAVLFPIFIQSGVQERLFVDQYW